MLTTEEKSSFGTDRERERGEERQRCQGKIEIEMWGEGGREEEKGVGGGKEGERHFSVDGTIAG